MKIYTLKQTQLLPLTIQEAWKFFSAPENLAMITPSRMNFEILSRTGNGKMFKGQIIRYKVTVLPFVRVKWVTEITEVSDLDYFIDEQRTGPYSLWHHEHHFKVVRGGVEMTDLLTYSIPFHFLGQIAHWLFVERELKAIFEHRSQTLQKIFPKNEVKNK